MEDKVRQGYLYDFYGELLNDHQKSIYESFVLEDLSLGEIAAAEGISRQAVHDVVRRCTKALEGYESKLRLVEKFVCIREKVEKICDLTDQPEGISSGKATERIRSLSREILEEL